MRYWSVMLCGTIMNLSVNVDQFQANVPLLHSDEQEENKKS